VRPFLRPATRGSVWRRAYRYRFCYLALAPSFAFLLGFKYYPMLAAIYYSFTDWDGLSAQFIGVQNYVEMIGDPVFQQAVHNMGFLAIFRLVVHLVMPLLAAELIFNLRNSRAGYFWRLLFLVPLVVPGIVVLLIWGFIYTPQLGLLNQLLRGIGAGALAQSWLGGPGIALPALAFVGFPWVGGIALLIFLAGLQNIPEEAIEAARLDGASGLRRVWALDVPLIVGQIKVIAVLTLIENVRGFGDVLILTSGGPGYATMVPAMYMYQSAFSFGRMGYSCAIGAFLFVLILAVTWANLRFIRSPLDQAQAPTT